MMMIFFISHLLKSTYNILIIAFLTQFVNRSFAALPQDTAYFVIIRLTGPRDYANMKFAYPKTREERAA